MYKKPAYPWMELPPNADFAKRLEWLLLKNGISKAELGRALGLKGSFQVHRWLAGVYRPSMTHLRTMAEYLDVNPRWLLDGRGEMQRTQTQ